ncbi:hypothetical protein F511_43920 [Dorcoceras hygrometricum]|uniref:Uncharacterized protein n=1 Tax=Dorcoceras hygrometricum TaxID=472368 RepID=A0A2Z7BQ17_9LAMI|nr:hypothetical protein F511_43920 [Dorcoceras hygrometricum]
MCATLLSSNSSCNSSNSSCNSYDDVTGAATASSTYMLTSALLISVSSNRYADLSPVDMMLTSSLLLTAFSSRYADVIIAAHKLLRY